ncbi:hypothetical protein [Schleiferilactobacillus perolens]|jgi:hypothetical protein|uniref:hypothetical protein n=1 Tax=Schleiferilactobacillus perolens TaxID=100468 RepID=UPI002354FAF1|nr:hypothetical protein [Schleiferilactobacillus perolens]MCI2170298.1 hypothetical protein [Schleiferilactobacillus perolens]
MLLAVLLGGILFIGGIKSVSADTIGDVLNNDAMNVVTDSNNLPEVETTTGSYSGAKAGDVWSMYNIPGLGRKHSPTEGSFVKWGYAGWTGAGKMPLSADISDKSGTDAVNATTSAWNDDSENGAASPVAISFLKSSTNHGSAYFSLNYVDKDDLVDFGNDNAVGVSQAWAGQTTTAAQDSQIYNKTGVKSKMKANSAGKNILDTANNQSFNGGYMQATGNVPIKAAIASSSSSPDATMAGDWAVMVRVQVAPGIDAKAFGASVDWNKSYYYLSVDSVTVNGQQKTINFPLQFDHHIYLDPNNSQSFFLKVKGIPFWLRQKAASKRSIPLIGSYTPGYSQLQLQDGNADYVDYLNNRQINASSQTATTLDQLVDSSGNTGTSSVIDDNQLITKDSDGNIQPNFATIAQVGPADDGNILWNIYDAWTTLLGAKSPVYQAGETGKMISLLNAAGNLFINARDTNGRNHSILIILNWLAGAIGEISKYFTQQPFTGSAHINFSFDMSKYANFTNGQTQSLTAGKFFAAPNADGTFNSSNGLGVNDAIKITMYDSSELVDPYEVTKNVDRGDQNSAADSPIRKALHISFADQKSGKTDQSGKTPADYAVIKATDESQLNNMGTPYPTYTNFTSWTGAIVPYDRMHWYDEDSDDTDDKADATFTDTLHSDGILGSDIRNRAATPDPASDGLLANDGSQFNLQTRDAFKNEENNYQPKFANKGILQYAGIIRPQRYANVYQLYDYSKSTPTVDVHVDDYDKDQPKVGATTSPTPASGVNLSGKTITSDLDGQKWHYTGAMNNGAGLPLADASINLRQTFNPTLNLSMQKLIFVPYSKVQGDNHLTQQLGTWRDPLSFVKNDKLLMEFNGFSSEQNAYTDQLGGNTDSHTVTGDWSENNAFNNTAHTSVMNVDDNQNVMPEYQLPVKDNPNDNFFFGDGTLTRDNGGVKLVPGYSLANGVDDTAKDNYFLLLDRETPTNIWYHADKEFLETDGKTKDTVHYLRTTDKLVHVVVNVTHAAGSTTPNQNNMIIRVPKVQKDADHVGATVANFKLTAASTTPTTDNSLNTILSPITGEANVGAWLKDNYTSFSLGFENPPQSFTYEYDYKISDPSDIDNIPLDTDYQDLIMDADNSKGTVTRAVSNGVKFEKLKSANLMHVPSFDFDTHPIPQAKTSYALASSDTATATTKSYFTVQSNNNNTSNWTLFDTLDSFDNADGFSSHDDFTLALGWPKLLNGTQFLDESDMEKADSKLPTDQYTDSNWRYANHYPFDLISNNHQNQLFRLDRTYGDKDNKETDLSRYYTGATLTVPAGETPSITSGKYTANLTYLLSDDGTLN